LLFNLDGSEYYSNSPEMFFRDGKRRIDFVLVYTADETDIVARSKRYAFLTALAEQMIEIEVENCQGEILARTGPQKAGFKDEAGFLMDPMSQPPSDADGLRGYTQPGDQEDQNPLETAIMAHSDLIFVKLHASWSTMIRVAEVLQFKKPLKQAKVERLEMREAAKCCKCFELDPKSIFKLPSPYRASFTRTRMNLFDIPEDYDNFFTPTERSLVVDYVLKRTGTCVCTGPSASTPIEGGDRESPHYVTEQDVEYERKTRARPCDIQLAEHDKVDLGIDHLISEKVFIAAFPLHDPSKELIELLKQREVEAPGSSRTKTEEMEVNMRTLLSDQWGTLRRMVKYQPLDYIRLYFGESVAFYFAWLGLYTYWLIPVSIFGLLVFCLSAIDISDDRIVEDVCIHGSEFVMCPTCNQRRCKFWLLNASCFATKMTHLVDNIGTVLYAVFMAIWATLFMENWKRYQNVLGHRWNVQYLEPVDEPPRPEFLALLKKRGYKPTINLITGREEPSIPFWSRKLPCTVLSFSSVILGMVLCLAALAGVIFYRLIVNTLLLQHDNAFVSSIAGIITTVTSSCINLICIFILKLVYDKIAVLLTDMENHRTQSEYDDSLTLKLYLLQFVNYYSSIFYIAFIQGTTAGLPGDKSVPIRSTGCDNGNCLFQLFIQLAIIMVGKQLLNFVMENTLPPIKRCLAVYFAHRRISRDRAVLAERGSTGQYGSMESGVPEKTPLTNTSRKPIMYNCRLNYTLLDGGSRPLFEEYLEMLIQYGFITMFVPAFPIAPLFALLNNMFELRTDAKKFLRLLRRPVVKRENGIGIWFGILTAISALAIRTNACLIAFTSEYLTRMTYMFYYSPNRSLEGYLNFTLSYMNVSRFELTPKDEMVVKNSTYCRYRDFREPPTAPDPYTYTPVYWHVLAVKFAFVFIFENVALALTALISRCIPDMPQNLVIISRHEARVVNELVLQTELKEDKDEKSFEPPTQQPPIGFSGIDDFEPEEQLYTGVPFLKN
uniref:Anoctamin n=1 Tax=Hydatigena taeniaeformis TaxID=6205 RepID=A0A158REV8_HYDTA